MPTYSLSARNQFRSPSGAVGEAPDGPGGIAALRDDVDTFLGVGGAEYCANATAMTAIPSSRKFVGKLAYRADQDITYRYVGPGNTPAGGTAAWIAWEKPPTAYTPTFTALTGMNTTAFWGISDGIAWATAEVVSSSGYAITSGSDVTMTIPTTILPGLVNGRGTYYRGGVTSNGSMFDLIAYVPGPFNTSGVGSFRIRVNVQSGTTVGAPISQNMLGSQILSPYTGDRFQIECRSPSGLVA